MKKRFYFIISIIISLLFVTNVNAEIIYGKDTSSYTKADSVSSSTYNRMFDNFSYDSLLAINSYFNENFGSLENNNKYVLFPKFYGSYSTNFNENSYLALYDSSLGSFTSMSMNNIPVSAKNIICFSFDSTTYTIEQMSCPKNEVYINAYSNYYGFPLWSNKDYVWSDLVGSSWNSYLYLNSKLNDKYNLYYDFNIAFERNEPVYTLMDLVGINTSKPSNKSVEYTINYYFDNTLDLSRTETLEGSVGSVITEFTDYSDSENYYLVEKDYSLTLTPDPEKNVFNIYYKSYKWTTYTIEYYFDDIRKDSYTETHKVQTNSFINEFTNYSDDYWTLVENEYTLTTDEDSSLNVLRIYFISKNYGTEYQTIDTSKSKIPFFFQFVDIKEMFSGINFDIFTQYEQFLITIMINLFFLGFIVFVLHYSIKMFYKVLQWFN